MQHRFFRLVRGQYVFDAQVFTYHPRNTIGIEFLEFAPLIRFLRVLGIFYYQPDVFFVTRLDRAFLFKSFFPLLDIYARGRYVRLQRHDSKF